MNKIGANCFEEYLYILRVSGPTLYKYIPFVCRLNITTKQLLFYMYMYILYLAKKQPKVACSSFNFINEKDVGDTIVQFNLFEVKNLSFISFYV